ncbi:MAG: helix-turn-helix domain-containing protein [Candidatus Bathyarchaeota archaeon]|nr:helix-turn-helix domain-containing protein [Candidatus Bathyarchaeota archaeon]
MAEKTEAFDNLEQDVFKALENQKRRDILRLIGEKKTISFTDILNTNKIPDSPTLSYHLRELAPFLTQKNGKYELTPMGKDAYSLLLKTASYNKVVLFQKKRLGATLGNLLLWAIGITAAAYLEVNVVLWAIVMPFLAFIATTTTWQLFEEVKS